MDILDRKFKVKKFFKTIFRDIDFTKENIRTLQLSKDESYKKVEFFNDIDELVNYSVNKYTKFNNTYFQLTTTNGDGGTENRQYAYVIGFDFDKGKQCNSIDDIMVRFKEIGLWYNAILDSGYGFHTYTIIEKTNNLTKYDEVVNKLCDKLGADPKAKLKTQILRIPYSYNLKGEKPKLVKIIKLYPKESIKPYSIDKLYNRYCNDTFKNDNKTYILRGNAPKCVDRAFKEGSKKGNRNSDLYNIVVYLKNKGEKLEHILRMCKEWNNKNEVKYSDLEYQCNYIYNNCSGYKCSQCENTLKDECKSYTISNFNLDQYGETTINIHTKVGRQCRSSKRKGVICMNGNELFIYNVLVNNSDILLSRDEILKLITDRKTKKSAISERTLKDTIKGLLEREYIEVVKGNKKLGVSDKYKINIKKNTEDNSFKVTYFINIMVIKGHISTTELKCYIRMRYLHHQLLKEDKVKGNIFTITMEELAKDLGTDKANISKMIKNLYENMILDRRAIPLEDDPNKFRYEYKLNM